MTPSGLPFARSPHTIATHRSAQAAEAAREGRSAKSTQYLELVERAGVAGLTDHETVMATAWPMSSVCSIRNGVRVFLWPSDRMVVSPYGRAVTAWRLASDDEIAINRMREAQQQELA